MGINMFVLKKTTCGDGLGLGPHSITMPIAHYHSHTQTEREQERERFTGMPVTSCIHAFCNCDNCKFDIRERSAENFQSLYINANSTNILIYILIYSIALGKRQYCISYQQIMNKLYYTFDCLWSQILCFFQIQVKIDLWNLKRQYKLAMQYTVGIPIIVPYISKYCSVHYNYCTITFCKETTFSCAQLWPMSQNFIPMLNRKNTV